MISLTSLFVRLATSGGRDAALFPMSPTGGRPMVSRGFSESAERTSRPYDGAACLDKRSLAEGRLCLGLGYPIDDSRGGVLRSTPLLLG